MTETTTLHFSEPSTNGTAPHEHGHLANPVKRIPDVALVAAAAAGLIVAGLAVSELSSRMAVLAAAE